METAIDLDTAISICQSLENLLSKSLGPNALQTMICTTTGKLLITSNGCTIMDSLHLSHPVGNMIIKSIAKHCNLTGDHSKRFVLIITEALRQIRKTVFDSVTRNKIQRQGDMRRELLLISSGLNKINNDVLPNAILPKLITHSCRIEINTVNNENVKKSCHDIIHTCFSGQYSQDVTDKLTMLLNDYIFMACVDVTHLQKFLLETIDDFDFICIKRSIAPVSSSIITEGIIVQRDLVVNCIEESAIVNGHSCLKYVLVDCSLSEKSSTMETRISVTDQNLIDIFLWKTKYVKELFQSYISEGISVILSTQVLSDDEQFFAKTSNLSVIHGVLREDIEYISKISGVSIFYDTSALVEKCFIGELDFCKQTIYGGHIELGIRKIENCYSSQQILLCAPTEGIFHQYRVSLLNAVKCVRTWTDSCHMSENTNGGVLIPGCGYSEFLLYQLLQDYIDHCMDVHVKQACRILQHALLAIPKQLHANSFIPKCKRTNFIHICMEILTKVKAGEIIGLDAKSGKLKDFRSSPICVVEPLYGNYLMVCHIIQLLQQLLKLESIVAVRTLKYHHDETDSDEENDI